MFITTSIIHLYRRAFIGFCLVLLVSVPGERMLMAGGLAVAPMRLVFEERDRSAEITLRNNDREAQVYRLSMIEMLMPEKGPLQILETVDPDYKSAKKMVRFSPRQVTLQPGQAQTVRVRIRKPSGLKDGEYRSHLLFQNQPDVGNGIEQQLGASNSTSTQIRLVPIFGVAIPVIVRQGKLDVSAALSSVQLKNTEALNASAVETLSLTIQRTGGRSVYGNLTVMHTPPGGSPVEVGRVNGVSVYTPGTQRKVNLRLRSPSGKPFTSGKLRVEFRKKSRDGGDLLAETDIALRNSLVSR